MDTQTLDYMAPSSPKNYAFSEPRQLRDARSAFACPILEDEACANLLRKSLAKRRRGELGRVLPP
jgi:hypothetical protein